ncbi:hypothetical protein TNCV_900841 [Trichonephila clavipes]|nr:hypothetical protein TNCV_900841 [Trichonephila clavipes]
MTLKTVLKNFLNYADTLEAQKKLGKDLYEVDFQVDLVANSSSSLPSYVSPTTPDNALPLSEDPDRIFHPALH